MKQILMSLVIVAGLITAPVHAQNWPQLTKENVGKGVGAVAGALLGTQIGDGRGKLAAVAAGTLAGYWVGGKLGRHLTLGDRTGINRTTTQAIYSGRSTQWRNPDTGARTRVTVRDMPVSNHQHNLKPALKQLPPIEFINALYTPEKNVNVRGGPGTDYQVMHSISRQNSVPVIGKVINTNWYLIAERGKAAGFVYAPLLQLSQNQPYSENAVRHAFAGEQAGRYVAKSPSCRIITQQVSLANGRGDSNEFKACQQADGNWVKI